MKNEFFDLFKPLKRKIQFNKYIRSFLLTESIAMAFLFFIIIYSKSNYVPNFIFGFIVFLPFVLSFIYVRILKKVTLRDAIVTADNFGFSERFITAYEILNDEIVSNDKINYIQIEDAFSKARRENFNKKYCIVIPKKIIIILMSMILLNVIVGFKYSKVYDIETKLEKNLVNIDKSIDNLQKSDNINNVEKYTIGKELLKFNKKLRFSKNEKEALNTLENAEKTFKTLEKDFKSSDISKLSDFKNNSIKNSGLKNMLSSYDTSTYEKYLNALNSEFSNMNSEKLKELLKEAEKLSDDLSDRNISNSLKNYLENIENGNFDSLTNGFSELKNAINEEIKSDEDIVASFNSISKELSDAKSSLKGGNTSSDKKDGNSSNADGNSSEGSNCGDSQMPGACSGSSSSGTSNGSGSSGSGLGRGVGHGEPEKIYTRDAKNYMDYTEKISGQENKGGETSFGNSSSIGDIGNVVDYKSVVRDYKNGALSEMNDEQIPYGLKSIVEEYFISLDS